MKINGRNKLNFIINYKNHKPLDIKKIPTYNSRTRVKNDNITVTTTKKKNNNTRQNIPFFPFF